MGWRSWNLYGANVDQKLIEGIMDGMVKRERMVDGKPTSLCDLGYCDVGLDDNWQKCGHYGSDGLTYHQEDGSPVINFDRFPSFKNMTDHAHKLGLTAGWYGNNCICSDHKIGDKKFYQGDTTALRQFGFDSWKLDGCGAQTDMQLWDDIIKATPATSGRDAIMVENCHWGSKVPYKPNATWCPWNFYRTSGDVRAVYSSVVSNLHSTIQYAQQNLSYPGCWAYPDMLEVGCQHGPGGATDRGLNAAETRSHFGAWAIVSSPLTLSHDVNNATIMDQIWDVISNKEVIAVNQAYAGHSGSPFKSSSDTVQLDDVNHGRMEKGMTEEERQATGPTTAPSWEYYYKPLGGGKTAVLLMNHGDSSAELSLSFGDIPGVSCSKCSLRDIWNHKELGSFSSTYSTTVASHDAAFLVVTAASEGALSATAPSGTYSGTKSELGADVKATITIDDTSHADIDVEVTGITTISVKCPKEDYTLSGTSVNLPNQDKPGDCLHDNLQKDGASINSVTYDASSDSITISVHKVLNIEVKLTK
jgi:alpha-galactosidase